MRLIALFVGRFKASALSRRLVAVAGGQNSTYGRDLMQLPFMPRRYLTRAEAHRVKAAITAAELGHRGEIQVLLEGRFPGDGPLSRARELFLELGLDKTRDGTGVLLYVAVDDRRSAVWAGPGLYAAAAPDFWLEVTQIVADGFAKGDVAGGLERALATIGRLLGQVAPGEDVHGNELKDQVHQR